jgi:phenylalanyl-tRNA synthetase beta chain
MKVSVNWLKELIDLDCSDHELIESLNKIGLMVEETVEKEDDLILDIETYPNRPDTLGHLGIARELSIVFKKPLKELNLSINWLEESVNDFIEINIKDESLCQRYVGAIVKEIKVGDSPNWLRKRLEYLGLRSINNVVDVTNYVLMLTGHPIHAFDLDKIEDKKVIIRKAHPGEKILTLEEKVEELSPDMLVIADSKKPIAIAGVIGGEESGVKEKTKNVLIESAYFDPVSIRKTSKRLGLITEASYRFERGADIEFPPQAAKIAVSLLSSFGGKVANGMIDEYPVQSKRKTIVLRIPKVFNVIGIVIGKNFIEDVLNFIGCEITKTNPDVWHVQIPSHRVDLEREIDLIEEIARFYGYENIPSELPVLKITENTFNSKRERINQIKNYMTSLGYDEVINYSFTDPGKDDLFRNNKNPIEVRNPISVYSSRMRTNLLNGLLQNIVWNINRGAEKINIFEIGKIYYWLDEAPKEELFLAIAGTGIYKKKHWKEEKKEMDFFVLKGVVEALIEKLKYIPYSFEKENCEFLEPDFSLKINIKGEKAGFLGLIKEDIRKKYEINQKVFVAEINLDSMLNKSLPLIKFNAFSKFPSIVRDISFVINKEIPYGEIENELEKIAPPILKDFELYDYYSGPSIPSDKISMTIRFIYSHLGKTLSAEEVQVVHNRIIESLKNRFGIKLRE